VGGGEWWEGNGGIVVGNKKGGVSCENVIYNIKKN